MRFRGRKVHNDFNDVAEPAQRELQIDIMYYLENPLYEQGGSAQDAIRFIIFLPPVISAVEGRCCGDVRFFRPYIN